MGYWSGRLALLFGAILMQENPFSEAEKVLTGAPVLGFSGYFHLAILYYHARASLDRLRAR
jgi:hypothetical protein